MLFLRNSLFPVILFVVLLCGFTMAAAAQDSELQAKPPVTQQEAAIDPAPVEAPKAEISAQAAPEIDLSDPALIEALDAREKADRAIAQAVKAQQEKTANAAPAETVEGPKKKRAFPTSADEAKVLGQKILDKIIGWLTSPSFLAQIAAIALVWFLAPIFTKALRKRVFLFRDPPAKDAKLRIVRDYIYRSREFLRAAMQVALLALFAVILKNIPPLGQDWLVKLAQGLAVVFLLYRVIKTFLPNPLYQKLATWIVIPLAVLAVFGYYDDLMSFLKTTEIMQMGDTPITIMTFISLGIFGAIFFYLGNIANSKGQDAIRSQETLDVGVREIVAKLFQIMLFIILIVLVLSFAGIPLSGLVVIFSAVGLGIGFGLQPIAANFISGLIILFDRSVKAGDFVVLPDGQQGTVEAINMRSTVVETADGKDIMVPNTKFTEDAYENWTHKDPRQRYEVEFSVHYDTDLDSLEDILIPEVLKHPQVLKEPELPDLELRSFGDSGVNMAIEFWCEGIDDGPNKFTSDVNFIVWRTLKAHNIEIPYPQRVVRTIK